MQKSRAIQAGEQAMSGGSMIVVELKTQIWVLYRKEPIQAYSLAIAFSKNFSDD